MNNTRKGLHVWSKEELMVTFYITKYGNKNMYLKTESDISKYFGVSLSSLKMQVSNFRYLMGYKSGTLSDYSKIQKEIFDEYNNKDWYSFNREIRVIINQDIHERMELLKKLGKDVKKMKLISNVGGDMNKIN